MTYTEGIFCFDESETVTLSEETKFTLKVSRGKLKLPPLSLYDFSQYCYAFFVGWKEKCSTVSLKQLLKERLIF